MNVLSLFDGISCGMVALERTGIPVERYVAYEIDKYAIKVSKKNYPQIEHCGDVTTADFTKYYGFDLLVGGSPCQSLSIVRSKTRQHLQGKSKLFFEFVRALHESNPRYFLFENVASMNEENKGIISKELGCEPVLIDSADFSAQKRPRLYWTNIPVDMNYKKNNSMLIDIMQEFVTEKYYYKQEFEWLGLDKPVCAILNINGHDILKRVNSPFCKCHTLPTCGGGNTQKKVYDIEKNKCRKLTPLEYERLQTLPDDYTSGLSDSRRYTAIGNGWTVDVIAHILKGLKKVEESLPKESHTRGLCG